MSVLKLINEIIAKKNWIILVTLSVALITAVHFYRVPFVYQSTISFFIDDDEGNGLEFNDAKENNIVLSKVANGNRLYHLAKSTEMVDYLIKKFNLYDHYEVDRNNPVHYESINSIVRSKIDIRQTEFNALTITVKDVDKMMAVNIANEIFNKLDAMNKDFIVSNVEKKIKVYDQLLSNSKKQSLEQVEGLKSLIEECKSLVAGSYKLKDESSLISDLKIKLALLSSELSSANNDLLKTMKTYEILAAALQKENMPNLRLINIALPDLRTPLTIAISWTIVLSLVAAFITFSIIGILLENQNKLKILFS